MRHTTFAALFAIAFTSFVATTSQAVPLTGGTGPGGIGRTDVGTSNLQLWLKADVGVLNTSAVTALPGDSVGRWQNQSFQGSARDVTNQNSRPPMYSTTSGFNGRPALEFVAVDNLTGNFNVVPGNTGRTIFIAADTANNNIDSGMMDLSHSTDTSTSGVRYRITAENGVRVGGNKLFTPSMPLNTPTLLTVRNATNATTSDIELFSNGTSLSGTPNSPATLNSTGTSTLIGSYEPTAAGMTGAIAEVAIFDRELNNVERQIVENHLSSKYGSTLAVGDVYSGDTLGYDRDVFGVGSNGVDSVVNTGSAGLGIEVVAGASANELNAGEFFMAGHATETNDTTFFKQGELQGTRWTRVWNIDTNGGEADTTLGFNFDDAGLTGQFDAGASYSLLYTSSLALNDWEILSNSPTIEAGNVIAFDLSSGLLLDGFYTLGINMVQVPEPSAVSMLLIGIVGLGLRRRRQTNVQRG